jgi:UDP-glucose 4-epimerase
VKVVVTGGAGFIGANLCRILTARSEIDEVVAIDDLSSGSRDNLDGLDVRLVEGTILDTDLVTSETEGADAVVHLAARASVPKSMEDPVATHLANATGTVSVLEATRASGVPALVVASSSSVYGSNPTLPKSEDLATLPMSPYAASKLATESYALSYQSSFGLKVLAFRFFNVFGPLQSASHAYAAVVPSFIDAALKGEGLTIFGDGTQSRDFTYVDTVGAVICDAILRKLSHPGPVNLAFGTRVNLLQLVELLERIFGKSLDVTHTEARKGDVLHSQADQSRLRELFPDVEPVELETGLKATIDWFRSASPA